MSLALVALLRQAGYVGMSFMGQYCLRLRVTQ